MASLSFLTSSHLPFFFWPSSSLLPSSFFSILSPPFSSLSLSLSTPSLSSFSSSSSSAMKQIIKSLKPKQIFRLKKSRSLSNSAPASFGSASYSSSSSDASSSSHGAVSGKSLHSVSMPGRSAGDSPAASPRFDFVQAFKMMDLDGDGKITRVDLESVLRRIGGKLQPPTAEEVEAMIEEIDADNDGCISLDELKAVGSAFESSNAGEEELREAFDVFDADHDGKITAEELHAVLVALGDARCTITDCRRMIAGVDKNGDGFVCFEDFTRMMDLQR